MKHVKLSDGLLENLVGEIVSRIASGTPGVKDTTLPREALKRYRAMTQEDKDACGPVATDADVDLLEKLLNAEELMDLEPKAAFPPDALPLTITLPPRLAAAIRLEAVAHNKPAERYAIEGLAERHKDSFDCVLSFDDEEEAVEWLSQEVAS